MSLIDWNPAEYSVKVGQFDMHHKKLVGFINQLYDCIQRGEGDKAVKEVLGLLKDYTHYHFTAEERLLKHHHYPDAAEHIKQHELFVNKVEELVKQYEAGQTTTPTDTLNFLKVWLLHHIKVVDRAYGDFFNARHIR